MNKSLISRVVLGFKWSAFGSIASRLLQFIVDIILTRLLVPEEFGLIAIALAILTMSEMLTEMGFNSALIQKQGHVNKLLNTAWTMEVLKGILLCVLLLIFSHPISNFYNDERTYSLLNVISILFIIRGCRNVGIIFFRKELEIHKQVLLDIIPFIFQLIVIIPVVFYIHNVWAIIIGIYVRRLAELILSYTMHPYRPSLSINQSVLNELFNFGKWIFLLSILGAIRKNITPLFIGKVFSIEILGYFNRAELFSTLLFAVLIQIIWQVGYPALSIIHLNLEKLKKVYIDGLLIISYFGLPMALILILFSENIISLFLTNTWAESIWMMKMLIPAGVLSLIGTLTSIVFQSCGKPAISTRISLYSLLIFIILIAPLSYYFGVIGLLVSVIISALFNMVYGWILIVDLLKIQFIAILKLLFYTLINSFIFASLIVLIKNILFNEIGFIELLILLIIGLIIFSILMIIGERVTKYRTINIINSYLV